jgi:hypothetical protein
LLRSATWAVVLLALAAPARAGVRASIPLPGGAAALADVAGLPASPGPARILLDVIRVINEAPPEESRGVDVRRARVLAYLAERTPAAPRDDVPLPLTPDVWRAAILQRPAPDDRLAVEILTDYAGGLLYYGLSALDDETLAYLARSESTLRSLREHAAIMAAFGRAFRVRGGRVATPGGPEYDRTWEEIVGARPTEPGRFLLRLVGGDGGRLAFFYDAIAHLDAGRLRLALGDPGSDAHARDLYRSFSRPEEEWKPSRRPFMRRPVDGAVLLASIVMRPDGLLAGPRSRRVWERVFDGRCDGGRDERDQPLTSPDVDIAWLASRIVTAQLGVSRERLRAFLFAQRVFPAPSPGAARDTLQAICGVMHAPALMLSLERIGVRDAALLARAAAAARRSAASGNTDGRRRLAIFQSSVAILEAARLSRGLDAADASELVRGLVEAAATASDKDSDAVVDWIERTLVPALERRTGIAASRERVVLAAMAGVRADAPAPPLMTWEGVRYRLDRPHAQLVNLVRIRAAQWTLSLDAALVLRRLARTDGRAPERQAVASLAAEVSALSEPDRIEEDGLGVDLPELAGDVERMATGPAQRLPALADAARALVADTLASIAYAPHLGPSDGPAARSANVARRHRFSDPLSGDAAKFAIVAWMLPVEEFGPGGGWRIQGALVGLDVGLARLGLRRLALTGMPPKPDLNDNDRRTLIETASLMAASDLRDDDLEELAAALGRGRQRAAALAATEIDRLADEAGLDEWRRQALAWIASRDPAAGVAELWLMDLLRLGRPAIDPDSLNAWGTATRALEGPLALRYPAVGDGCLLAGRPALGATAFGVTDLMLRVVEVFHELRLPAALAPDVFAFATQDLIDTARPTNADDRAAIALAARALTRERIVDYVAALAADGPLVPEK